MTTPHKDGEPLELELELPSSGKVTIDEETIDDPAEVRAAIEKLRAAGVKGSPADPCLHYYGPDARCVFCGCEVH